MFCHLTINASGLSVCPFDFVLVCFPLSASVCTEGTNQYEIELRVVFCFLSHEKKSVEVGTKLLNSLFQILLLLFGITANEQD